jgi:hypothetical protein
MLLEDHQGVLVPLNYGNSENIRGKSSGDKTQAADSG